MPRRRIPVRKIKEALRLKFACGLTDRQVARSLGVARSTAAEYFRRFAASGLPYPLPEEIDDASLSARLFPSPSSLPPPLSRPLPDFATLQGELRKKGVTLMLLWEEYRQDHPDGYQYSRFCDHYRLWLRRRDLVMRQEYKAGQKMFVDYAGKTMPVVVDRFTGEVREAQIFVSVLGASNYTFAEATWTQSLADWTASHGRAFEYFQGVCDELIPDNLKSAVTTPSFYDPALNPTYEEMAAHYGTAVLPARVRKARDKAKVETGVLLVTRWILARLRHRTFFSLAELNAEIRRRLEALNQRPFRKMEGSRQSLFETMEKPALKPLPERPFEYGEWKKARVNIDYHVDVERHYYSVPYPLRGSEVDVRFNAATVEILHQGKRVASHVRSFLKGRHTTLREHLPASHREYRDWPPSRLVAWAQQIGPRTSEVVETILSAGAYPVQGYRRCLGILRLGKKYGEGRLESACERALALGALSYQSIQSILKTHSDKKPLRPQKPAPEPLPAHDNVRGPGYYIH